MMTRNYAKGDIVSQLFTRKSSPFQANKISQRLGECKLYKGITNYIYDKYWGSTNTGSYNGLYLIYCWSLRISLFLDLHIEDHTQTSSSDVNCYAYYVMSTCCLFVCCDQRVNT